LKSKKPKNQQSKNKTPKFEKHLNIALTNENLTSEKPLNQITINKTPLYKEYLNKTYFSNSIPHPTVLFNVISINQLKGLSNARLIFYVNSLIQQLF
jgi:hypothetical protein